MTTTAATMLAIPAWYYNSGSSVYDQSLIKPQLLSNLWDAQTIAEIGKTYLKQHPSETGESKLVELLSESIFSDKDMLGASINQRIKEDYKTGRIVTIDGWILSITEGRQCALYSLVQTK